MAAEQRAAGGGENDERAIDQVALAQFRHGRAYGFIQLGNARGEFTDVADDVREHGLALARLRTRLVGGVAFEFNIAVAVVKSLLEGIVGRAQLRVVRDEEERLARRLRAQERRGFHGIAGAHFVAQAAQNLIEARAEPAVCSGTAPVSSVARLATGSGVHA